MTTDREEMLTMLPIKSRFSADILARTGCDILATVLGLPTEQTWASSNQGMWNKTAAGIINLIEAKALAKEEISFDDLARLISSYMGSELFSQTTEEKFAWMAVARAWSNAVVSRDAELDDIFRTFTRWAAVRIEQAKPKPVAETNGHVNGVLSQAIQEVEHVVAPPIAHQAVAVTTPTFTTLYGVIDMKISEYENKTQKLREFKANLTPEVSDAMWEVIETALKGETR